MVKIQAKTMATLLTMSRANTQVSPTKQGKQDERGLDDRPVRDRDMEPDNGDMEPDNGDWAEVKAWL